MANESSLNALKNAFDTLLMFSYLHMVLELKCDLLKQCNEFGRLFISLFQMTSWYVFNYVGAFFTATYQAVGEIKARNNGT